MKIEGMVISVLLVGIFFIGIFTFMSGITPIYNNSLENNFTSIQKINETASSVKTAYHNITTNSSVFSSIPVLGGFMDSGLGLINGAWNAMQVLWGIPFVLIAIITDIINVIDILFPIPNNWVTPWIEAIVTAIVVFALIAWARGKSW